MVDDLLDDITLLVDLDWIDAAIAVLIIVIVDGFPGNIGSEFLDDPLKSH